MEGAHLEAGAVASIEGIVHPITAARLVMEDTSHVLLVGPPATRFAQHGQLNSYRRRDRLAVSIWSVSSCFNGRSAVDASLSSDAEI